MTTARDTGPAPQPASIDPYFNEWRHGVDQDRGDTARLLKEASVTFERIRGQLDEHDRRIKSLEHSPDTLRANWGTWGGCLGQIAFACLSSIGTIIAITSIILTLTR